MTSSFREMPGIITTVVAVIWGLSMKDSLETFRTMWPGKGGYVVFSVAAVFIVFLTGQLAGGILTRYNSATRSLGQQAKSYKIIPWIPFACLCLVFLLAWGIVPYLVKHEFPPEAIVAMAGLFGWLISVVFILWKPELRFRPRV